uniref:Uncharacterized protein n=1 Tax=Ditylenchus dipsaci TaxID=166011 RepID=A0A915DH91_9BILA
MSSKNCFEYETQYFGFSSKGFVNLWYNEGKKNKAAVKSLRDKLLNRLFQHGKLDLILKRAQAHASEYIFKVPACVTLPPYSSSAQLQQYDEEELLAKIEKYQKEILEIRHELKYLDVVEADLTKAVAVCETLKKSELNF